MPSPATYALRTTTAAVRAMRAPLLLGVIAFFVLSNPAQVLELYLILARGRAELWAQVLLAFGSLAALAFFLTYAGRSLARAAEDVSVAPDDRSPQAMVFLALPIAIGLLPLIGCIVGLWRAWKSSLTDVARAAVDTIQGFRTPELLAAAANKVAAADPRINAQDLLAHAQQINNRLDLTVAPAILNLPDSAKALSLAIVTAIVICVALGALLVALYSRPRLGAFEPTDRAFHPGITVVVGLVALVLLGLITAQHLNAGGDPGFDFTAIPRQLGTLALVNASLISLVYVASLATRWSDRHGIALILPMLVAAAIISMHNWNDNHGVRLVTSSPAELASRKLTPDGRPTPTLIEAFDAWLKARPAEYVGKFAGKPYPIYVVAAQGGGMYAASLSGLTLARLYDRCPALRHHVFAVSGVSGGSVGSGYFAALLGDALPSSLQDSCTMGTPAGGFGRLETQMDRLLQADLLAPVSASFLFPDLLQRFVPFPVVAFDRARAFEAGMEQAWTTQVSPVSNPLREPFWRHWRADGSVPMLFLNTTVADTGQQVPLAPVNFSDQPSTFVTDIRTLRERAELPDDQDVPLSTAMSLSARFPLVMPAGLVETPTKSLRVVDGGYYENSGVDTATEIIQRLAGPVCSGENYSNCKEGRLNRPQRDYAFRMIVLTDYDPFREVHAMRTASAEGGMNEMLSPLRAMLNARVARGELIVGKLQPFSKFGDLPGRHIATTKIALNHRIYGLPLGWQLSKAVQDVISAQIGEPDVCVRAGSPDFFGTIIQVLQLEHGFELLAAERENRTPRISRHSTPFAELLKTLQDNHCLLSDMLFADGVLPQMTAQSTPDSSAAPEAGATPSVPPPADAARPVAP